MVDVITDNIKPQVDAATGGGKKMSLQDDYDMGKDTGVFVYEENKNRYLKEKNVNATMPAVSSEDQTEEVKANQKETVPLPKKSKRVEFAEDTEGVTKPILRSVGEGEARDPSVAFAPIYKQRGITRDPKERGLADTKEIFSDKLEDTAKADVEKQRTGITMSDLVDSLTVGTSKDNDLNELPSNVFAKAKTALKILSHPQAGSTAKENAEKQLNLALKIVNTKKASSEKDVTIAFDREGKFSPTDETKIDPTLLSSQEAYQKGRRSLAKLIDGTFENVFPDNKKLAFKVEQSILDNVSTGQWWNTTMENTLEIPRAMGLSGKDFLSETIQYGSVALFDKLVNGKDISESNAETKDERARTSAEWKKTAEKYLNLTSLATDMNNMIHKDFELQLKDNKISQEEYDDLAYFTSVDPDGTETKSKRVFVSEGQANTILMESIDQLSEPETFMMIAAENMAGIYGFAKNRAKSAAKYKNKTLPDLVKKRNIEQIKRGNFRYTGMSDIEAARAMKSDGVKIKINESLLKDALQVEKIDRQYAKMVKEKSKLGQQLDDMKRSGIPDYDLNYIKVQNDYNSLKGKIFRNAAMQRTKPVFRESLKIALPASLAQYAATEMFAVKPGEQGLSFYDAQAIGAISHVLALATKDVTGLQFLSPYMYGEKIIVNPIKYFVNQAGNMKSALGDVLEGGATAIGIPGAIGVLRSADMKAYNEMVFKTRGTYLSASERNGMKYIFMMAKDMSEENLAKMLKASKNNVELDERVAAGFGKDTEEYKIIREITRTPFATATGLSWLKSAEALNNGFLDVRDLKDGRVLDNLVAIQEAKEQQLTLVTRALEKFKERIADKTTVDNTEAVNQFIEKYETLVARETADMIKKRANLKDRVTDLKETVFSDPDVPVTTALSKSLSDAGTELRMKLDKTLSRGEALEKDAQENFELLNERAKIIESNMGDYKHADRAALLMEEVMESWIEYYHAKGKVGYKAVDEMAKKEGRTIDISSLLVKLKNFDDTKSPLTNFFSRNGQFFNSNLNKRLRTSLNQMAARSLDGMKETTLKKLMDMAKTEGSKHFINPDADALDVALYWSQKGKLKAFNALPSEVEDLYAAFRDYGYRRSTSNSQLSTDYFNQADEIRDLILTQSKGHYDKFVKAAKTYKDQVFDRQDGVGPLSDFLKSKTGRVTEARKEDRTSFYKNNYKGVKPRDLFKSFIGDIETYIRSGKQSDAGKVKDNFEDIVRQMSENIDGVPTFDLDSKEGRLRFETMQKAIVQNIYSNWGQKVVDSSNKLQDVKIKKQLLNNMGGYDFQTLNADRLKDLSANTKVTVIEGGNKKPVSLLDFTKLIEEQKDIVKVMETSQDLRDKYKVFKETGNETIKNIASEVMDNINIRNETIEKLRKLTALDEDSFLKAIVKGRYTKNNIDLLREQAAKEGVKKEDFNEAVAYMLTNGIINSGNLKTIPNNFLSGFDGLPKPLKGFDSPEEMLANLRNDNIKPLLQEIIGDNHVAFLDDIADYLQREKASQIDIDRLVGLTRPMGTNEIISRAFNIARGMVSPTYVGAELAFRLASNANIDMIKMAAKDPYAAELMAKMMEFPEQISKLELNTFRRLSIDFVLTEYARMDMVIPDYYYDPQASDTLN